MPVDRTPPSAAFLAATSVAVLVAGSAPGARAQAVQAAATAARAGERQASVLEVTAAAAQERETLLGIRAGLENNPAKTAVVQAIDAALVELRAAQTATTEADVRRHFEGYLKLREQLLAQYAADLTALPAAVASTRAGTVPQVFHALQNVVFTVGYDVSIARRHSAPTAPTTDGARKASGAFSFATNMLGAAAGAAFDAVGADGIKTYLTQNIAAGTAIPSGTRNSLTSFVGLGLGEFKIGSLTLWPVINVEQTDTSDTRTPAGLLTRKPDQKTWSAPTIAVGIVLPEGWLKQIKLGKAGLIPTVGVRVPHYFPGDPFSALGALFSARRTDYVREGSAMYNVGISIPLVKVPDAQP